MSTSESQSPNLSDQSVGQDGADLTITDAIPIGIVVLAPDGTTLYVNRLALDRTGTTLDQVKGKGQITLVCHPDDLDRILDERRMGLSKGVPFALESRLLLKDGNYHWYLSQYRPLVDERGQVIRWYVTATDIDARKRAEEKLRQSEQDLRTIIDAIRQPIVVLTADGGLVYANQVALDNSGLTLNEFKEGGFLKRVGHPDDAERVRGQRNAGLSKGIPFDLEARALFKGGHYRWQLLQYNPLKDESGQIIRWYVTATDIDDRKRAEEKLRQSEEDLRTTIDTIRQVIVILAPDGTTLYVNRVALDRTGLTAEDVKERGFYPQVFHPDDVARLGIERRERLLRGAPFELEMRSLLKSGEYRWYLTQYNPLKDETGRIIRWYATATDIDDRKRAEEKLRQSEEDLRTMINAIRQYVVVISPDGELLHVNRVALEITGVSPEVHGFSPRVFH
jgi:PAS domain S-box-containing protein